MPRPKGSQNKITTEVKEQLQNLIDEVVNRIDVEAMTIDQKLKLLQLSLHYVLPRHVVQKRQRNLMRIYRCLLINKKIKNCSVYLH